MAKKRRTMKQNRSGFTLAEVLAAILILLMVTAIAAVGVPAAAEAYAKMVYTANAQVLISTTMTRLRDELCTATNVSVAADEKTVSFVNDSGRKAIIFLGGTGDTDGKPGVWMRETTEMTGEDAEYLRLLVSEEASNNNLHTTYEKVEIAGGIIKFTNLCVMKGEQTITDIPVFEVKILTYTE